MSPLSQRRWIDPAVAAAVFAYNLPVQGFPITPAILFAVGLCVPYAVQRRCPSGAFAVIAVTAYVQLAMGVGPLVADVILVLALYSIAREEKWRTSVPAGLIVVVWALLVSIPSMDEYGLSWGDVALLVSVVFTAWLLGTLARTRNLYMASVEERARQDERTNIAREIHDIVSHSLSAIVLLSEGAAATTRVDPDKAASVMLSVRDTSREAMAEMRSMLSVLHSGDTDDRGPQPGLADIDGLLEQSRAVGIPVTLTTTGSPTELTRGLQLVIYRVVQEALTNVRKHAGSVQQVRVQLEWSPAEVVVRITDDGHGGIESGGWGLIGMQERVAAQGGSVRAQSTDEGFEVVAALPIGGRT